MKTLPKGANAPLASSGTLRVELHWPRAPAALDAVCFAVGDDGRIPSDDWFIFYNQRQSPGAVVDLSTPVAGRAELRVQPERLPPGIQRLVIAAAMTDGAFRDLIGARLTATPATGEPLAFELTEAGDEQALIFAELYRHGAGWKLRAVGQGFRGGLQPLAEHFGVAVADDAAPRKRPRRRRANRRKTRPRHRDRFHSNPLHRQRPSHTSGARAPAG
jgi:stress response protein SCP2